MVLASCFALIVLQDFWVFSCTFHFITIPGPWRTQNGCTHNRSCILLLMWISVRFLLLVLLVNCTNTFPAVKASQSAQKAQANPIEFRLRVQATAIKKFKSSLVSLVPGQWGIFPIEQCASFCFAIIFFKISKSVLEAIESTGKVIIIIWSMICSREWYKQT